MRFSLWHRIRSLFTSSLVGPSYESVARDWNIPPRDQSGDVSWFVKNVDLKGKHVWVARPSEPKERALLELLNETCREMGVKKVPKLLIYADYIPNAASEGFTGEILISTNLADIMSRNEIKAAMGHELAHHKHRVRDLAFMGVNAVFWLVGVFGGLKLLVDKCVNSYEVISKNPLTIRQKQPWIKRKALDSSNVILTTFSFLAALTGLGYVQNRYQRWAESQADLEGAKVAGTQAMVDSLTTLDKRAGEILEEKVNWGEARDPNEVKNRDLDHPRTNDRINNIRNHASKSYIERKQDEAQKAAMAVPAK